MFRDSGKITVLLSQQSAGDSSAFDQLMTLADEELRAIAHRQLQERVSRTRRATATRCDVRPLHEVWTISIV